MIYFIFILCIMSNISILLYLKKRIIKLEKIIEEKKPDTIRVITEVESRRSMFSVLYGNP